MKQLTTYFVIFSLLLGISSQAQNNLETSMTTQVQGIYFGNVSLQESGVKKDYFRLRYKGDFPIGKFGLGLDIDLLFNQETGGVREQDWDEWQDYLDKVYYIRYGEKDADDFYIKLGGLDYSYIGFRNIFNGYSNMLEYPQRKKYGIETQLLGDEIEIELLVGDLKEVVNSSSTVVGARFSYEPENLGGLNIGFSFGADLNHYGVLLDDDNDGIVNELDFKPLDKNIATEYEYREQKFRSSQEFQDLTDDKALEGKTDLIVKKYLDFDARERGYSLSSKKELEAISSRKDPLYVLGADASYPLIEGDFMEMTTYAHAAHILDYGFGVGAPGIELIMADGAFRLFGEYRFQSKEFIFGYFNQTYEIERITFVKDKKNQRINAIARESILKDIKDPMQGFLAGLELNLFDYILLGSSYQRMSSSSKELNSLQAKVGILDGLIPNIQNAELYYFQNNVDSLSEWKTPSSMAGARFTYNMGGVGLGLNYKLTFQDLNGDGKINSPDEEFRTVEFTAGINF